MVWVRQARRKAYVRNQRLNASQGPKNVSSGAEAALTSGTVAISTSTDATNATARTVTIDNLAVASATSSATLTAYDTVTTYNAWGLPVSRGAKRQR